MKRYAIAVLLSSLLAGFLCGTTWNAGFEASPAGTDLAADLDTFIQNFKLEVRRRASVESIYGTGTDDNGLLRPGSARAFSQNAAPGSIDGPGQYNSAGGVFAGALLQTDEVGATTRDIGAGRLWVDVDGSTSGVVAADATTTDAHLLSVWSEGDNAFRRVVARDQGGAGIGADNRIYNGSFEITDGTGSAASTTVASGWTNLNTATIAYATTGLTEGSGLAMRTTAAGGPNEGASQSLAGLKASTTYIYRVRVLPAAVIGGCNLNVRDGTTTATDTSLATGAYETLEVQHTTTAAPATVTVDLRSTADTNVCDWDHVTAFERYAVVPTPGVQAIYTQDNTADATIDTTFGNNPFVTSRVTIPGPGYMVLLDGAISYHSPDNSSALFLRLVRDDCAGGAFTAITPTVLSESGPGAANNFWDTVPITAVDTSPVAGGTCIYRIEVREDAAATTDVNPIRNAIQTGSYLRLVLTPTR